MIRLRQSCQTIFVRKLTLDTKIVSTNRTKPKILEPVHPPVLTWYSCGPTVYAPSHLGHGTTFIRQDTIRRILSHYHPEWTILLALGMTDIDDKIIKVATDSKTKWDTIAKKYESQFFSQIDALGVQRPDIVLRVSDHMDTMIAFIGSLVSNNLAYVVNNSVYFDVEKFSKTRSYGKLRNVKSTDEGKLLPILSPVNLYPVFQNISFLDS